MEKEKIPALPDGIINPYFIPKNSRYVSTSTGFFGKSRFFKDLSEAIHSKRKKKEKIFKLKKTYRVFSATKGFKTIRIAH